MGGLRSGSRSRSERAEESLDGSCALLWAKDGRDDKPTL